MINVSKALVKKCAIKYLAGKCLELSGNNSLNKLHNERARNN
jgi:hypothetical protein